MCKEMSDVFAELEDSYFSYPRTEAANSQEKFHINLSCGKFLLVLLIKTIEYFI